MPLKRRHRRRAKRNPTTGDQVAYWVGFATLLTGAVAIWAWKQMTDAQKKAALNP